MFLDVFDAIYIINLRKRSDRRSEMMRELNRVGLERDRRVQFFDAAEPVEAACFSLAGAHGCYLSHLEIYERERGTGHRLLVLEDDCEFVPAAMTYELADPWDIFYGGFKAQNPSDLQNSNIIGSHCMGYSPLAVDLLARYLRDLLEPAFQPDPKAAAEPTFDPAIRPPVDGAIVWFRRAHPELKTVFADISEQRPSRSDIGPQSLLDRTVPDIASMLRKAKRWMR